MDIFEEATDAIIHSVDSQDRSQAQDPPTYGHWLGSGWGQAGGKTRDPTS